MPTRTGWGRTPPPFPGGFAIRCLDSEKSVAIYVRIPQPFWLKRKASRDPCCPSPQALMAEWAVILALTFLGFLGVVCATATLLFARTRSCDAPMMTTDVQTTKSSVDLMHVVHFHDWTVEGLKALWCTSSWGRCGILGNWTWSRVFPAT